MIFPADGERSSDGSFSFSKTHVLFPIVMRYLMWKTRDVILLTHSLDSIYKLAKAESFIGFYSFILVLFCDGAKLNGLGFLFLLPVHLLLHVGSVAAAIVGQQETSVTEPMDVDLSWGVVHDDHIGVRRLTRHGQDVLSSFVDQLHIHCIE